VTEADRVAWTVADLRPYADVVLDAFGPSRVMFGSDWPVCLLAGSYEEVVAAAEGVTAGLTAAERDEVFGGTAARVYGLPEGRR
jgi:L-fuconolactonase